MKPAYYYLLTILFTNTISVNAQVVVNDEITIQVIESAYEAIIDGKYTIQGMTWSETKDIFEQKIDQLKLNEEDSPENYRKELVLWRLWFAKFRFQNGEFKQYKNNLNDLKTFISQNDTSRISIDLSDIKDEIINEEFIFNKNVNNKEDLKFSDLYIKLRGEDIPEKRKVVYKNGEPVKIQFKYPTKDLNALQKSRLDYLNTTWFYDLAKQESDMQLGFFTHTDSLKNNGNFSDDLNDGYVLSIPDLPILNQDQEYIFIFQDGNRKLKRYRKSFNLKNYDSEVLEIDYMEGWALQPSPSPGEIELRVPANEYSILKSTEETISNGDQNYLIEVKKKSGSSIETIDPMEAAIIKEGDKSYYVYYIDHNENIELEVSVSETQNKKSGLRKYFIWVAVAIGIGGYFAN